MFEKIKKIYLKLFGDYYISGKYNSRLSTGIVVAHGYIDMQIKLYQLRQVCHEITVI